MVFIQGWRALTCLFVLKGDLHIQHIQQMLSVRFEEIGHFQDEGGAAFVTRLGEKKTELRLAARGFTDATGVITVLLSTHKVFDQVIFFLFKIVIKI